MEIRNKTFFILFTPIFYICYLPLAFIKSLIHTLLVPFDTQRFANAYVAFFQNGESIYDGIFNRKKPEASVEEHQTKEKESIGFKVFPSAAPGLPSYPSTSDDDEEEYEDY